MDEEGDEDQQSESSSKGQKRARAGAGRRSKEGSSDDDEPDSPGAELDQQDDEERQKKRSPCRCPFWWMPEVGNLLLDRSGASALGEGAAAAEVELPDAGQESLLRQAEQDAVQPKKGSASPKDSLSALALHTE